MCVNAGMLTHACMYRWVVWPVGVKFVSLGWEVVEMSQPVPLSSPQQMPPCPLCMSNMFFSRMAMHGEGAQQEQAPCKGHVHQQKPHMVAVSGYAYIWHREGG